MTDVRDCLRIPNEDEAYGCMKEAIKKDGSACPSRLVLLLEPTDCDPCEKALQEYAEDIKNSSVHVVHTTSKDGEEIIEKNKIEYAPVLLLLDCHNNIIE